MITGNTQYWCKKCYSLYERNCKCTRKPLGKVKRIKEVIQRAEEWIKDQVLPESTICMSALKDIRRIVNE